MSMLRILFPAWLRWRRKRPAREEAFCRRVDGSQTLQHLCGFDTELYSAINSLKPQM